jgi:hypothetical protein
VALLPLFRPSKIRKEGGSHPSVDSLFVHLFAGLVVEHGLEFGHYPSISEVETKRGHRD